MSDRLELIYYHIQTNEGIHLSDKTKWDIASNLMSEVLKQTINAKKEMEYWRSLYIKERTGKDVPKIYDLNI